MSSFSLLHVGVLHDWACQYQICKRLRILRERTQSFELITNAVMQSYVYMIRYAIRNWLIVYWFLRLRNSKEFDHSRSEIYALVATGLDSKTMFEMVCTSMYSRIEIPEWVFAIEVAYFSRNLKNSLAPNMLCKAVLIL